MSLTILTTQDERLVGPGLANLVSRGIERGPVVVLVPTFAEALTVSKELSNRGMGLGVEVSTPRSWARDQWDVWGDGRRVVDDSARALLMTQVLQDKLGGDAFYANSGAVRLLCEFAKHYAPWIEEGLDRDDAREDGGRLSPAERRCAGLVRPYEEELERRGFVESSRCQCELAEAMISAGARLPQIVLAGFVELSRTERAMVVGFAAHTDVSVVLRAAWPGMEEGADALAVALELEASQKNVPTVRGFDSSRAELGRTGELDELLGSLYGEEDVLVQGSGHVSLLEAAGPLAEAELVARALYTRAQKGTRDFVVVVPDVSRAWRELAPKLVSRGLSVQAQDYVPVLSTDAGRAFVDYVRTVAYLSELAETWPPALEGPEGTYVQVGDMSWWPPQQLVDFLLCDIAHVDPSKARALDVAWRGNRLLSPTDVINQLLSAKVTSDAVERATRELLRGRIGSAASKLLAAYVAGGDGRTSGGPVEKSSLAREEAVGSLAAVLGVASTLKELGMTADPSVPGALSLAQLVDVAVLALQSTRMSLRPCAKAQNECGRVQLLGRAQAAILPPASCDVAVLCGLTSEEFAIPVADDELSGMVEDLELDSRRDSIASQRTLFHRLCSLPKDELLLERALFTSDAKDTYPSVALTELFGCYAQGLPCEGLSEDAARANLSHGGTEPACVATELVAPAGRIDSAFSRLVTVPQEGRAELQRGLPVLSASQIESYLECPLKWFSLRRLRLQDNDAGFSPLEMGTFAHRVLELTFSELFEEGRAQLQFQDAKAMEHAREVLERNFKDHLRHQYIRVGSHATYQALVAHTALEESQVERLLRDLSTSLDYAAQRFVGFMPHAFEWEFGRGKRTTDQGGLPALPEASYAGVRVTGTVDRIDINSNGQAVIIDYKHKGPAGFFAEYAAFKKKRGSDETDFVLPRRIQALLYAQVVRKAFPDLRVVGALYLGTRGTHELSGAVEEGQAGTVFGGTLGDRRAAQVVIPADESFGREDKRGMEAFLDATEEAVARAVERLREGHIEANPIDAAACSFCPVANCERRLVR